MTKPLSVLIIEDSASDADLILRQLLKAGYEVSHERVETADQMQVALERQAWDLIITDYSLPQFTAISAIAVLQDFGRDIPVIVVSGSIGEDKVVTLMKAGAEDYVAKDKLGRLVIAVKRSLKGVAERRSRREAVAALQASEEKYRQLVENANAIIIKMDRKGKITFFNDYAQKFFGYSLEEILGKDIKILVPPIESTGRNLDKMLDDILRNPDEFAENVNENILKNGGHVWISWRNKAIGDPEGNLVGNLAIGQDITKLKRSEDAFRESEQRFRSLFENSLDGIMVTVTDGIVLSANAKMCEMLGMSEEEIVNAGRDRLVFQDERLAAGLEERARTGKFRGEITFRHKDGSLVPVEISSSVFKDIDGTLKTGQVVRDIRERKQTEQALRQAHDELEQRVVERTAEARKQAELLDLAHDAIIVTNEGGRITFWSSGAEKTYGWTKEEAMGKTPHKLLRTKFPIPLRDIMDNLHHEGVWEGELIHARKDGERIVVLSRWALRRDETSNRQEVMEVNTDITARKEVEEALRKAAAYNRSLIEASIDPLVTIGPDGKITDVNTATEKVTGYSRKKLIGTDFSDYFTDPMRARAGYQLVFKKGLVRDYELEIRHRDGHIMPVFYNASVYEDEAGKVVGVFAAARDVTERKRAEESLRETNSRLSRAEKVSHSGNWELDLNTKNIRGSEEVARIYEFDSMEWPLARFRQAALQDYRPELDKALKSLIQKNVTFDVEFKIRRFHTGHIVDIRSVAEYNPERNTVFGIIQDITSSKRAQESLRSSENRYRRLFDEAVDGIVLADFETGIVKDCNQAFLRLTGYERSEVIGMSQTMFHPLEDDRPPVSATFALHRSEKNGQVLDAMVVTKSGAVKAVEIKATVLDLEDGKMLQGFFRDVTEERRGQRERETTLTLLRLLNDRNQTHELIRSLTCFLQGWTGCEAVGIRLREGDDFPYFETRGFPAEFVEAENFLCARDLDGRVKKDCDGNAVLECMCGNILSGRFNPELPFFTQRGSYWTNSTTDMLASTTEADRQAPTRNRCNREGYESVALIPLRYGDETLGLLQVNDRGRGRFTPETISFLENAGEQIGIALAQRRDQAALILSEKRFRDISDAVGEYIFEFDLEGRVTYVSGRVFDILGYSPGEVLGRSSFDSMPSLKAEETRLFFAQLVRNTKGYRDFEQIALTKSGRPVWLNTTFVPIFDDVGALVGYRGAAMDVSERKRADEALLEKSKALEELNTALKVLIDHYKNDQKELEEKMASNVRVRIIPYIAKLKQTRLDIGQSALIEIIERSLRDISSSFSKSISSDHFRLAPKEMEVAALIKEGKTTKEIAKILGLGKRTVDSYRDHIRDKLGLANKKINLRTYLLSIDNT